MFAITLLMALTLPPETAPPPRAIVPKDDATRSTRWILRLKVQSGRDYVDQLKTLGAFVLLPDPSFSDRAILIPDLTKPKQRREATAKDLTELAGMFKLSDHRKDAVLAVAKELEIDFTPVALWVFLPKQIEDELAQKEKGYRSRKVEEIEQTVFRVVVQDGKVEISVDEQSLKKKP